MSDRQPVAVTPGLRRGLRQRPPEAPGDKVVVAGRLRWREYDVDGTSRQAVDITADSVVPVPRTTGGEPATQPAKAAAKKAPAKTKAAA